MATNDPKTPAKAVVAAPAEVVAAPVQPQATRVVPALTGPIQPAILKTKSTMYLGHLVERLGKYVTSSFLPTIKSLAQRYVGRKRKRGSEEEVVDVLVQLLKEVPMYRDLALPDDEGTTILDKHVRDATARIPELDSLIQQTLQFRSMLISADQGNAVNIDLSVPSTRDFVYRVLVDVADELSDDPLDAWLHARPQEIRAIAQQAVRGAVDSYLPYIRKQLDAAGVPDIGNVPVEPSGEDKIGDYNEVEDADEDGKGDAQQMTIKVSKGALRRANPKVADSDEEHGEEEKGGKDRFPEEGEDEDEDDF